MDPLRKKASDFYKALNYIEEFGILITRLECLHYIRTFTQNSWENPTACGLIMGSNMKAMLNNDLFSYGYYCKDVYVIEDLYYHTVVRKAGLYEVTRQFKDNLKAGLYITVDSSQLSSDYINSPYDIQNPLKFTRTIPETRESETQSVYRLMNNIPEWTRAFKHSDDETSYLVCTEISKENLEFLSDQPPVAVYD